MHGAAREYKEKVKNFNDSRQQEGKEPKKPRSVEMDNFQNPQVRKPVWCFCMSLSFADILGFFVFFFYFLYRFLARNH